MESRSTSACRVSCSWRKAAMVRNLVITAREVAEEGMEELENINEFIDEAEKRIMAVNERGRRTA